MVSVLMQVPYPGFPFAFSRSYYGSAIFCVSPEHTHTVRLLQRHLQLKPGKLLITSMSLLAAPATFGDLIQLHVMGHIPFHVIDQTDHGQSTTRTQQLFDFELVHLLRQHVPASQGTAMLILVGGAYLGAFRDAPRDPQPLALLHRVTLLFFTAYAVVTWRLALVSRHARIRGYSLQTNALTHPTALSLLVHCGGFVGILLKAAAEYPDQPVVPQEFGDWRNESFNARLRDANYQRTANLSATQVGPNGT